MVKYSRLEVSGKELLELKELSDYLLNLSDKHVDEAVKKNVIKEIKDYE